ncbi:AAA family ATPase [Metapseudomonas furukawaii]|uniref:AAA family ATPase n=1 Tax=Metapseudomonas furukawaii TaxID=1149133 RepID=UPI00227A81B7|nr:AAA family ATPase [Pseudomonas furukawaii]WAG76783.1 AAA family ATPase [Pseudomonas furukawaii]
MLIVFCGLPGVGKTTIARPLASRLAATYLRLDAIEQAIRDAGVLAGDVGSSGYRVAWALARANLDLGRRVVVDCVNPVSESREAFHRLAREADVPCVDVEVLCSDAVLHRERVETRVLDLPGLVPPTWEAVCRHEYETWESVGLRLDTAQLTPEEAVEAILDHLARSAGWSSSRGAS